MALPPRKALASGPNPHTKSWLAVPPAVLRSATEEDWNSRPRSKWCTPVHQLTSGRLLRTKMVLYTPLPARRRGSTGSPPTEKPQSFSSRKSCRSSRLLWPGTERSLPQRRPMARSTRSRVLQNPTIRAPQSSRPAPSSIPRPSTSGTWLLTPMAVSTSPPATTARFTGLTRMDRDRFFSNQRKPTYARSPLTPKGI